VSRSRAVSRWFETRSGTALAIVMSGAAVGPLLMGRPCSLGGL
jgi:hypothetical protein